MVGITLNEAMHPGAFIVNEKEPYHCRDVAVIALSQTIVVGQLLGRANVPASVTSSMAPDAANTGNGVGTIDGTTPVLAGAKNGVYRAVCIAVAANGGEFAVNDPKGIEIGRVAVGATFAKEVKFAIADGSADFVAGDAFNITVGIEDGDYQYEALDLTKAGDEGKVAGIAIYAVVTDGSNTQKIAVLVRGPAEVRASDLTFPSGATSAQIAELTRQLEALGIVCR